MISAARPIRHAGCIAHASRKSVVGLAVDEGRLACATEDCVSVWQLAAGRADAGASSPALLSEVMRYDLGAEGRRTVTHIAFRGGLLLAAGSSKAAKKRREKHGMLSQITPGTLLFYPLPLPCPLMRLLRPTASPGRLPFSPA